jgi:hypothetical protein
VNVRALVSVRRRWINVSFELQEMQKNKLLNFDVSVLPAIGYDLTLWYHPITVLKKAIPGGLPNR